MVRPWYVFNCFLSRVTQIYAACKKQTSDETIMIALAILLLRHRLPSGGGRHGGGGGGGTAVLDVWSENAL